MSASSEQLNTCPGDPPPARMIEFVHDYVPFMMRFRGALEKEWQHVYSQGCHYHDLVCCFLMVGFSLQGMRMTSTTTNTNNTTSSDPSAPAASSSLIPFFIWCSTGMSCAFFTYACLRSHGALKEWYLNNRTAYQIISRILRIIVYSSTILVYYDTRFTVATLQKVSERSDWMFALSLALKAAILGSTTLQWQVPIFHSTILSFVCLVVAITGDHTLCMTKAAAQWHTGTHRKLALWLEKAANTLIPLHAFTATDSTTVSNMSDYSCCMMVHSSFSLVFGHLLPLAILSIDEAESRSWFLAFESNGSAILPSLFARTLYTLAMLPIEAALIVKVFPEVQSVVMWVCSTVFGVVF